MVTVSYLAPNFLRRLNSPSHELLYKTVKKRLPATVVDATGGLGSDSMLFAAMGAQVTVIEKSAELAGAIHQALIEALQNDLTIAGSIRLLHADSLKKLPTLSADVCYLDPLFSRALKGKPKKKAQNFIEHGDGTTAEALFQSALKGSFDRIIMKMPAKASPIASPTYQLSGRSHRFDIYQL